MRVLLYASFAFLHALPAAAAAQISRPALVAIAPADQWEIGPIIRGRNYSVNMPLHPRTVRGDLWAFDFPAGTSAEAGHIHYVTFRPSSLASASRITLRYRIDAGPATRFIP